ncbi:MAG: molecular chaperone TorD family protein [Micrococcales bacterium]|nr:molecular chaperone TorD family protein [Micrococcales bacterium]
MSLEATPRTETAEVFRALGVLCEAPHPSHRPLAAALELGVPPTAAEHTQVFALGTVPYASVYLGAEGMLGGEAADRVAGFWRALRLVPPAESDHLAALLGLLASLTEAQAAEPDPARAALRGRARAVLLHEHLLPWVPTFARAVAASGSAFYAGWAALLVEVLVAEGTSLEAPETLPVALAEAPGLPDEVASLRELAEGLLAPVRSGLVLTRPEVARGARDLGLGLRIGERAFVLASMLEQDPVATLDWVAHRADAWAAHHLRDAETLGPTARFWAARATTTATTCRARRDATEEALSDDR